MAGHCASGWFFAKQKLLNSASLTDVADNGSEDECERIVTTGAISGLSLVGIEIQRTMNSFGTP